jgi:hypothetical protein
MRVAVRFDDLASTAVSEGSTSCWGSVERFEMEFPKAEVSAKLPNPFYYLLGLIVMGLRGCGIQRHDNVAAGEKIGAEVFESDCDTDRWIQYDLQGAAAVFHE